MREIIKVIRVHSQDEIEIEWDSVQILHVNIDDVWDAT